VEFDQMSRNGYMLKNPIAGRCGYDWWWHSLVGENRKTKVLQPFFIEYFIMNPALNSFEPILGQHPRHQQQKIRPCYAMLKVGTWKENGSKQLHNFYSIKEMSARTDRLDVRIGDATLSENRLRGSVSVSETDARDRPELMSDAGSMRWDLRVKKILSYSAGYPTSRPFRWLHVFEMFWHVQGMLSEFSGEIEFDGEVYDVRPETSYGYQDKNWGTDFTNPWIWLNCNNLRSEKTGEMDLPWFRRAI
jgi:tocopherol cyclase